MNQVPSWVRGYIGIPWKPLGRDRDGCDCWGIVRLALREQFNVIVPAYDTGYHDAGKHDVPAIRAIIDQERPRYREIATVDDSGLMPLADQQAGDVLVIRQRGVPSHVALVVTKRTMLHIEDGIDSTIEDYTDSMWRRRLVGCYRYVG